MTMHNLEMKAREVTPAWLQNDIDDMLSDIKSERESDPESWGDDWNFFEVLYHFESSDEGDNRRFKLALTKIERHIGVQKKLKKGEESIIYSSRGTRTPERTRR